MATYVLLPGGWAGGWQWRQVASIIRAAGHEVYTPTLTGLGERVHLATPDVDLDTHIQDVVNVLEYEDLHDVILVGYSYSGMVSTGVAERVPERIRELVYLDAFIPENGRGLAELINPEITAGLMAATNAYGDGWRVPHNPPDAPYRTPQPVKTFTQPITIGNPAAAALPRIYIACLYNEQDLGPLALTLKQAAKRARSEGWRYRELATGHIPWETAPQELAKILLDLA